jgi:hypothetical protein
MKYLYRVYHLKRIPTTITYDGTKMKSETVPPQSNTLPVPPVTLESTSPWLLGRYSHQLRKSCAGANMMYSRAKRVFILKHYFTSKSFAAVRETFSNAYPDKQGRIKSSRGPSQCSVRGPRALKNVGCGCDLDSLLFM